MATWEAALGLIVAAFVIYGFATGRRVAHRNFREAARRAWGNRNGSIREHSQDRGEP